MVDLQLMARSDIISLQRFVLFRQIATTLGLAAAQLLILATPIVAQIPTAEVTSLSQSAANRNSKLSLRPSGKQLVELHSMWSSEPNVTGTPIGEPVARLVTPEQSPAFGDGRFETTISHDCDVGLCELRFLGRFGISNPKRFLVSKTPVKILPTQSDQTTSIEPRIIWSAKCKAKAYHNLELQVQKGDHIRVVVYAKQIDSQAIPAIIALDPNGIELGRARAVQEWPAELSFKAAEAGAITLKLYDFLFRGGEEYECLLQVAQTPANTLSQPIELDSLLRPNGNGKLESLVAVSPARIAFDYPGSDRANSQTEPVSVPFMIHGLFNYSTRYKFAAKKGQEICFEVASSQLGQLTDPYLAIFRDADPQEKRALAYVDDGGSFGGPEMRIRLRDPYLSWKAPSDGVFVVQLFDNNQGKRPLDSQEFMLFGRAPSPLTRILAYPGFPNNNRNIARPHGLNLMRGGTAELKLLVMRKDGCQSAIEITAEDLPDGVACSTTIVPRGAREASLILEANGEASAWTGALKLSAVSSDKQATCPVQLLSGTITAPANPARNSIDSRICSTTVLSVSDLDVAPLFVSPTNTEPTRGKPNETVEIPISVTRRESGKGQCLLRAKDLPSGCSCPDLKVAADKNEGKLAFKIGEKTPPGSYTFWLQNETKVKWKSNPQSLKREEDYLAQLESSEGTFDKEKLDAEIAATKKRVEALKKSTAPKDITVWLPSRPIKIVVEPSK